ncbi:MAG: VOC family protein [Patescibacteria group bacterium]
MKLNPYLNFNGNARQAFEFYEQAFGVKMDSTMTFGEMPADDENNEVAEDEKDLIMHVSIPLGDGQYLMANDVTKSMGKPVTMGNNNYISVHPDSKAEADRLFAALSEGGEVEMPMADQFWGDYYGSFKDKFGVCWMINFHEEK